MLLRRCHHAAGPQSLCDWARVNIHCGGCRQCLAAAADSRVSGGLLSTLFRNSWNVLATWAYREQCGMSEEVPVAGPGPLVSREGRKHSFGFPGGAALLHCGSQQNQCVCIEGFSAEIPYASHWPHWTLREQSPVASWGSCDACVTSSWPILGRVEVYCEGLVDLAMPLFS